MAPVLNPTSLADVAHLTRPLALARDRVVPVLPALAGLVPEGGLARGSAVAVGGGSGSTSLALALAAGPSADGAWVVVVGCPDLGLLAAAELGVALERLALVAEPPADAWPGVVAALIGAVDVVLVGPSHRVRTADARRLAARARERGTVLIQVGDRARAGAASGIEVDLRLTVTHSAWQGLGPGHGHLRARRVTVEATGRRQAARPRQVDLWLPDATGAVSVVRSPVVALPGPVVAGLPGAYAGSDVARLVADLPVEGLVGDLVDDLAPAGLAPAGLAPVDLGEVG